MAHHRHRVSLERILDFSTQPRSLLPNQRAQARTRFNSIISHFNTPHDRSVIKYNRPLLIRYTYEYGRSELSQDMFLFAFLDLLGVSIIEKVMDFGDRELEEDLRELLIQFADLFMDNLFLPLKATGVHTPQPSPAPLSAVQRAIGGEQEYIGTPERLSTLRRTCLVRDHYRCVISHKFDAMEATKRFELHGTNAQDEEGSFLRGQSFDSLQVAHILPHALCRGEKDSQLNETQQAALNLLDMFDHGIPRLIEGNEIDRPFNTMSLAPLLHTFFGGFKVFFEPVPDEGHTYQIKTFLPDIFPDLPVTRTLYVSVDHTIDPPLPRLLALHRAIAHILHLSGAGEYIDKILRDMEDIGVHEDGSTELGRLVMLRLGDWVSVSC